MSNFLTERDFDQLALAAAEMLGFQSGATVPYDVAGYTRCRREPTDPARLPIYTSVDLGIQPASAAALPDAHFADTPYPARIAGFRRGSLYGPDEIGQRIQSLGIAYNDGLGNGLYESLLVNRKYGLKHVLEAPILGFPLPGPMQDWPAFEALYQALVQRWLSDLRAMQAVYTHPLSGADETMVVLWARHYPLDLFKRACDQDPTAMQRELIAELGFDRPPLNPQTTLERLAKARFWGYVQARLTRLVASEAAAVRQALGPGIILAANPHELPVLDFEGQARVYDYPAVAVRPLLLAHPLFLRHYVAYFTQLFHDMTGKAPMVSVRMNLSAATPRFVPSGDLIAAWYDQAVRHGAGAFYFWTRDYPPQDGAYDGPLPGNPTPSTRPAERWEATLQAIGRLSTHRRFLRPAAQAAILVPTQSALLERREWQQLYAAFAAFNETHCHTRFLSDRQAAAQGVPPEVKLLVAPVLEFVSPELRGALDSFSARGGALFGPPGALASDQGAPAAALRGLQPLDPKLFTFFEALDPLQSNAAPEVQQELAAAAAWAGAAADRAGVDAQAWLFAVGLASLPPAARQHLHTPDPEVQFAPWQYEHGSDWITPYLKG